MVFEALLNLGVDKAIEENQNNPNFFTGLEELVWYEIIDTCCGQYALSNLVKELYKDGLLFNPDTDINKMYTAVIWNINDEGEGYPIESEQGCEENFSSLERALEAAREIVLVPQAFVSFEWYDGNEAERCPVVLFADGDLIVGEELAKEFLHSQAIIWSDV